MMKEVDVEELDPDSESKLFEARHLLDSGSKVQSAVKSQKFKINPEKLKEAEREAEEEIR